MRVEMVGGLMDGKVLEVIGDDWHTVNFAIPSGVRPGSDLSPAATNITYRFEGSIRDDGTRRLIYQPSAARPSEPQDDSDG